MIVLWPLCLVRYVDTVQSPYQAVTRGPYITIREDKKSNNPLLEHEFVHVKQWYMTLTLHGLLYRFSKKYRYFSELQAYRKQLSCYPKEDRARLAQVYANQIVSWYDLDVKIDVVLDDLYVVVDDE